MSATVKLICADRNKSCVYIGFKEYYTRGEPNGQMRATWICNNVRHDDCVVYLFGRNIKIEVFNAEFACYFAALKTTVVAERFEADDYFVLRKRKRIRQRFVSKWYLTLFNKYNLLKYFN